MNRSFSRRRSLHSFTLVELLVVMAIIALMIGILQPALKNSIIKAQSVQCVANLRSIGSAASLAATDNNNLYPRIDQAATPIYSPAGSVPGLVGVLGTYGVSTNTIQCPIDLSSTPNSFTLYGSSYEWDPVFDDENPLATVVYISPTMIMPVNSSRVRLAMDFNPIHHGKHNVLFGDGHVSFH
jgi:prepilin-type N-terminal cleavage/methylation domain-containing protein/prepilin-type processing-associated H-X9-DG protein